MSANNPKDKVVSISLKGLARTESGKLTKTDYFKFLRHNLDDYSDIVYTPEEALRIQAHLQRLSTGSAAMVPLFCSGSECPFAQRCILQQMGKAPYGKQCTIELELMRDWTIRYFEEYDVDPNSFTEVAYINELAEIEIYLFRLNMNLAKAENAELVIEQSVGVDNMGNPILQKQLSPFMEQKEKLQNRRSKIIKLMVGDRQEKYKKEAALKIKLESDSSTRMSHVRERLDNLNRTLDKNIDIDSPERVAISAQDLIDEE